MSKSSEIVKLYKRGFNIQDIIKKVKSNYNYVYTVLIIKGLRISKERSNVPKCLRDHTKVKRVSSNHYWRDRWDSVGNKCFLRRGGSTGFGKCPYCELPEGKCNYQKECEYQNHGLCSKVKGR